MNLPLGYAYASTYAGIRKTQNDDLALIVTGLPANAAAVFTQNRVQAAPVTIGARILLLPGATALWPLVLARWFSTRPNP